MITPQNINAARRLLASWPAVNAARIAKDRKPYVAWQREAKPLAGFDVRGRPVGGLVHKILSERVALFDQEARASQPDTLPTLPDSIVIHLPPNQRKRAADFLVAQDEAHKRAGRSPYFETTRVIREHAHDLQIKARERVAFVMDAEVVRLLDIVAQLDQAADLIDLHVAPDEDNG
jgi:hypothetical protein